MAILPQRPANHATPGPPVPIGIPSRADLWYRLRPAQAILGHHPLNASTALLLAAVLDGVPITRLVSACTETSVKSETSPLPYTTREDTP